VSRTEQFCASRGASKRKHQKVKRRKQRGERAHGPRSTYSGRRGASGAERRRRSADVVAASLLASSHSPPLSVHQYSARTHHSSTLRTPSTPASRASTSSQPPLAHLGLHLSLADHGDQRAPQPSSTAREPPLALHHVDAGPARLVPRPRAPPPAAPPPSPLVAVAPRGPRLAQAGPVGAALPRRRRRRPERPVRRPRPGSRRDLARRRRLVRLWS